MIRYVGGDVAIRDKPTCKQVVYFTGTSERTFSFPKSRDSW